MPCTFYNLCLYNSSSIATKNSRINIILFALYVGGGGKWKSVNPKTVALFPFVT